MNKISIVLLSLILVSGCSSNKLSGKEEIKGNTKDFKINQLNLKVKSIKNQNEVKPKEPQGYYKHYKKIKGYHYQVLSGRLVNLSNNTIDLDRFKVQGISKSNVYQGKIFGVYHNNRNFSNKVYPKENKNFHIISIIDNNKNDPVKYKICYDNDVKIEEKQNEFDICINLEINNKDS